MGTKCTVFSVGENDFQESASDTLETSLPKYDDLTSKAVAAQTPLIELGQQWQALHFALGNRPVEDPLAFLAKGGEPVPALDDGERSSGRYFSPARTRDILNAVRLLPDAELAANLAIPRPTLAKLDAVDGLRLFDRLRAFLAQTVSADRGVVVHLFL